MRKEELIKQVAESTGIAICEVRTVIEAALKETVDAVVSAALKGFDKFFSQCGSCPIPKQGGYLSAIKCLG